MSEPDKLRLATRGSPLARWQAERVGQLLGALGIATELVVVETEGDRRRDVSIDRLGGQGVFVKEVQAAVARGDADAAVHSAKDLPASELPGLADLHLAAFPERADVRDTLIGGTLDTLPTASTVATGSARRRAQLSNIRPDLLFADLRGNLATRIATAGTGRIAAVVVAQAALDRLGWLPPAGVATEVLRTEVMVPQVGQGALAVECRADDARTSAALSAIDDPVVRRLVSAERAFLAELGGGCTLPVGAYAQLAEGESAPRKGRQVMLSGMLAGFGGTVVLRQRRCGADGEELGREVARDLLERAGEDADGDDGLAGPPAHARA
ncbi:MAG: hydroxymethylbilane synthase [Acidimicrobiales bacterium]